MITAGSEKKFYLAGSGLVSAVGGNTAMTAAMLGLGISAYKASHYTIQNGEKITMAQVPGEVFAESECDIDQGSCFNIRHDRVIRLAIIALRQACQDKVTDQAIPLILAMPDKLSEDDGLSSYQQNLANNVKPWIETGLIRSIHSGRASGMEAIEFAFHYLHGDRYPYILVGGSDSHEDDLRLMPLEQDGRLLVPGASGAFAPGEAASFLLLTPHINLARQHNGQVIALSPPGMADEPGHLSSDAPYRGEGLDNAFKKALNTMPEQAIDAIYSSMNGENYWAKEYGVAFIRNRHKFKESVRIEHPADCYGDVGSATTTTLIAIAAEQLFANKHAQSHLVYASSDTAKRGALVIQKQRITSQDFFQEHNG